MVVEKNNQQLEPTSWIKNGVRLKSKILDVDQCQRFKVISAGGGQSKSLEWKHVRNIYNIYTVMYIKLYTIGAH